MSAPVVPDLVSCLRTLVAHNSISSVLPEYDQSNMPVIDTLAQWFSALGFHCDIQPIANFPGKANLIATLGAAPAAWCSAAIPTPCPATRKNGSLILSP